MRMIYLQIRAWVLWHRLEHAKAYRTTLERIAHAERAKADYDVEWCETVFARAQYDLARAQVAAESRA